MHYNAQHLPSQGWCLWATTWDSSPEGAELWRSCKPSIIRNQIWIDIVVFAEEALPTVFVFQVNLFQDDSSHSTPLCTAKYSGS